MPRYPRRDLVHVAISPSQGGCGASHTRPVTHGVPDPDWALDCPQCEKAVENDPLWAPTKLEIPETPDEQTAREALEKQGVTDREKILAAYVGELASKSMDDKTDRLMMVETLAKIAANLPNAQANSAQLTCSNGHPNLPTSRFCGECGISLSGDSTNIMNLEAPDALKKAAESGQTVSIKNGIALSPQSKAAAADYSRIPVVELRRIAEQQGINPKQSKRQLIEALS